MARGRKAATALTNATPTGFANALRDNAIKEWGTTNVADADTFLDSVYGIPVGNDKLPLQYLLGIDVLALERCITLVGSWGTTKSSLGWYFAKLFLEHNSQVVFIDTEHKTNPDQVRAIINNDELLKNILFTEVDSLDKMLHALFYYTEEYNKLIPDKSIPMLLFVDSLNAVTSEDVASKIMAQEDVAGFSGARNAGQIQEHMQTFVPKCLKGNPISLVVVNHQKLDIGATARSPFMPAIKKEAGGGHKDFAYTWKFELMKAGSKKSVHGNIPCYKMKIGKSSLGSGERLPILVPYTSTFKEDGVEIIEYDWDSALVDLLTDNKISATAVKEVIQFTRSGSKCSSKQLGLTDVSAKEMGKAIHADADIVKALQDNVLHIRRKRVFGCQSLEIAKSDSKS